MMGLQPEGVGRTGKRGGPFLAGGERALASTHGWGGWTSSGAGAGDRP